MKHIVTIMLLGIVVASCSSPPSRDVSIREMTQRNPDIANIAPEGRFTEEAPVDEKDSPLPIITPNAPPIILTPIQGNETSPSPSNPLSTEHWKTFTSSVLGVSLEYPADWLAEEETDRVLFTSPSGATIQMRADTSPINNGEFKIGNRYCTSRINAHDLIAEVCADRSSFLYTAQFALQDPNGAPQWVTLSTETHAAGEVFEVMFNSVRLTS